MGGALALLALIGCSGRPGGAADAEPPLPAGRIVHGPFEIVVGTRRLSTGAFPNTSGNPFASRSVSDYRLQWKGRPVDTGPEPDRWWRVLRLVDAPTPALLLVTTRFTLASEDDQGRLRLQPINAEASSNVEVQWLDADDGQPGPTQAYGIEAVADLEAGTRLQGGRWLRIGSRTVLDVSTLTLHPVDPWVPHVPGVPVTSLSRQGDTVRAFSPGRSHYVLMAGGPDHGREDRRQAWGLLVVDIARGTASELRFERQRYRFASPDEVDAAWVSHHFEWRRDAAGVEQLAPRARFTPWPWRAQFRRGGGAGEIHLPRMDARFMPTLAALVAAQPGARVSPDEGPAAATGMTIELDGCRLRARAAGADRRDDGDQHIGIWPEAATPGAATPTGCEPVLRRLAGVIDRELATGRHDALIRLGEP